MVQPTWNFEASVLLGLMTWTIAYILLTGPANRRLKWGPEVRRSQQIAFHLGTLSAFVALVSPLDNLADRSLFSAHMAQHMLLTFAAAPLWLVGMPGWLLKRLAPARFTDILTYPLVAFALFNGVFWIWHLPAAYDAALSHSFLHIFEHLSFIGAAFIGWWPVLRSVQEGGLRPAFKLAYLFPSLLACTALAALISLSPLQLYRFYGDASLQWGLSPLVDQQAGGLVMWLPGDMIYLFLIAWTVKRLFDQSDFEGQQVRL